MSYSFSVEVKDGKAEVKVSEGMLKHIPEGEFRISGHEDERSMSLFVTRVEGIQVRVTASCNSVTPAPKQS